MKFAVCLVVKNEARDLAEWLAYYGIVGFDTILVYDNGSVDGTACVATGAGKLQDIRIISWEHVGARAQMEAYQHAMKENAAEFDWIAALDADEFLVVHSQGGMRALCEAMPPNADAIAIDWAMFGANGHEHFPDAMITEAFTRRSEAAFAPNRHVKCLVRPGAVQSCPTPHAFIVPGRTVRPNGLEIEWMVNPDGLKIFGLTRHTAEYDIAQINHYFTRSRAHWAARLARGNFVNARNWADFDFYNRNEVEDRSALAEGAAVRRQRDAIMALVAV